MANCPYRRRYRPCADTVSDTVPAPVMEADAPMNRYLGPGVLRSPCPPPHRDGLCEAERALLEQMVELSSAQNQLLVDLLGAVNSLTAALLSQQLRL